MNTTQKTRRLCGWAVILSTNHFVLTQNWSLRWSKLALWKPGLMGINCSIFLYQNSFGANQRLALTRKSSTFSKKLTQKYQKLLRTTVPLVSYIRNSLRFWYYASLSTCCQNLEQKYWAHRENFGENGGQTFKGSDREKCQF